MDEGARHRSAVREALDLLGVRNLVLGIQDPAFPPARAFDAGRGTPYGEGGAELLRFIAGAGFTGLQFGPQGMTPPHSPSPYEGALFSRNILSVDLRDLAAGDGPWGGLLGEEDLAGASGELPAGGAVRVPYRQVYDFFHRVLRQAYGAFRRGLSERRGTAAAVKERLEEFRHTHSRWLVRDGLYEVLRGEYGPSDWRLWEGPRAGIDRRLWSPLPGAEEDFRLRRLELLGDRGSEMELYAFSQMIVHDQHERFQREAGRVGIRLYGDLQAGLSDRDAWSCQGLFLPGYRMGAPPSRTNPAGQPWGYPVLNPSLYLEADEAGPVERLLAARMAKIFSEYDGVRIDHPHGLVCPWVYREGGEDPFRAVRQGARLLSSPDLPDHPELAPLAIVSRAQLNREGGTARYADDWVVDLAEEQVARYGLLFQVILDESSRKGRRSEDLVPEVLSSLPYTLERVLGLHGLGRFRVTQKADPASPEDVYRSENARPADWVMVGTHDTEPIWLVAEKWRRAGERPARADYLARRLASAGTERERLASRMSQDDSLLVHAQFADLFASPAKNVMVFFTDFFGYREPYNLPGTISELNWSLRLPESWRKDYHDRAARLEALNLPLALAMALRGRRELEGERRAALCDRLLSLSGLPGDRLS